MKTLFCTKEPRCMIEKMMQEPPGYRPRGQGVQILGEKNCKNRGSYEELVDFVVNKIQFKSLKKRIHKIFESDDKEIIFMNPDHRRLFYTIMSGKRKYNFKELPHYTAAVFLLSADDSLWEIAKVNVSSADIYFDRIKIGRVTLEQYILWHAAKDVYKGTQQIRLSELADQDLIADSILKVIINAFIIRKFGVGAIYWDDKEAIV